MHDFTLGLGAAGPGLQTLVLVAAQMPTPLSQRARKDRRSPGDTVPSCSWILPAAKPPLFYPLAPSRVGSAARTSAVANGAGGAVTDLPWQRDSTDLAGIRLDSRY